MKKILFTALVLVFGLNAMAQESPLSFGVKAGVNLSNVDMKFYESTFDAKIGFQVGVTLDYALTPDFYLQSGLLFTTKGAKENGTDGNGVKVPATINPMYLELPVMAAYKLVVSDGMKVVFNAGPYLAYGVAGKVTVKEDRIDVSTNIFQKDGFKRFDFGVGGGVGFEFGEITANLGYELGLANIADSKGANAKNRNAFLAVGYKF